MTRDRVAVRLVAFLWLALTISWGAFVVVTEGPAWQPALWIAATLGPLTSLDRAVDRSSTPLPDESSAIG